MDLVCVCEEGKDGGGGAIWVMEARRQKGYQGGAQGAGILAGRLNSDGGMATAYDVRGGG
jgi:hypothetical protein